MKLVMTISWKVDDIIQTWKTMIPDPLNCDIQSLQECISTEDNPEVLQALLSTFRHLKDIQDYLNEQKDLDPKVRNIEKNCISLNDEDIFSSDSDSLEMKKVNTEVQCDLSGDESEKSSLDLEMIDQISLNTDVVEHQPDSVGNGADETVYEDCEEEFQQENPDEMIDNDTFDGEDSLAASSDVDSEPDEDTSWVVSEDSSGSECGARKRMTMKDLPKVNFNTTSMTTLGMWLSDTGPVHLNTMCHCKGSCMRNCSCRTADISCSKRCGCKKDKCSWRRVRETEQALNTDEEYKEKLRVKKT
eukprot:GFUD01018437.1.p1 GENE.GFUD01018437.1~~GFUD01018437.1.p1  ORF type:complete len:302 (-),score=89.33 GFUD01018437.1:128-1033(-)